LLPIVQFGVNGGNQFLRGVGIGIEVIVWGLYPRRFIEEVFPASHHCNAEGADGHCAQGKGFRRVEMCFHTM
jgi:hypothetical protein